MFFYLSKTLYYILTPAGLVVSALLMALLMKNPARRRWALRLAFGFFFLFGNGFFANELARFWEVPSTTFPRIEKRRVGVVLTGGMLKTEVVGVGQLQLGDQADRINQALLLYKSGHIQKILISGGIGHFFFQDSNQVVWDEGTLATRFLVLAGVPAIDILREERSWNTHENALFSAAVLKKQFVDYEVVLITSGIHQRRAMACFQKEGVSVRPHSAASLRVERKFTPDQWLFPSEKAFYNTYSILREMVGYIVYRMIGYL